jgi:hypothetical protein
VGADLTEHGFRTLLALTGPWAAGCTLAAMAAAAALFLACELWDARPWVSRLAAGACMAVNLAGLIHLMASLVVRGMAWGAA